MTSRDCNKVKVTKSLPPPTAPDVALPASFEAYRGTCHHFDDWRKESVVVTALWSKTNRKKQIWGVFEKSKNLRKKLKLFSEKWTLVFRNEGRVYRVNTLLSVIQLFGYNMHIVFDT